MCDCCKLKKMEGLDLEHYYLRLSVDDAGTEVDTMLGTEETHQFGDILENTDSMNTITQQTPGVTSVMPVTSVTAFKLTLTSLLLLASLVSNLVVFVIFSTRPVLLSVSNKLVLHLAVCNFILTLVTGPMLLNGALKRQWDFGGKLFCDVTGCVVTSLICVSSMTLLFISMDRYQAIARPLRYSRSLTTKKTYKCIVFMWALCLSFSLLLFTRHIDYDQQLSICLVDLNQTDLFTRVYVYLFSVVFFIVPLGCMLVVYLKIFGAAKRTTANARRNSLNPDQPKQLLIRLSPCSEKRSFTAYYPTLAEKVYHKLKLTSLKRNPMLHKDDFKAAITGFLCVSTFTLSWIPFFFVLTIKVSNPELIQDWMGTSAIHVALTSCIFNPCLYVFRSQLVRREVDSYLRRRSSVDITGVSFRKVNHTVQLPKIVRHQSEPCTHSPEFGEHPDGSFFCSISMTEKTNSISD